VFLCLHGAGHSALSFAALAKLLKKDSTCISFDFRGHGLNTQTDPLVMDSANLVNDTLLVVQHIAAKLPEQSIILVGHSMGGSIAVKAAHEIQNTFKD
jgi:protein phosphatase methylesterase 1